METAAPGSYLPSPYSRRWESELAGLSVLGPDGADEMGEESESPQAIVFDPRAGQVRGILRRLPAGPLARSDLGALAADPGFDVLISRGVPDSAAWRSANRF